MKHIRSIVVPTDFSPLAEVAAVRAAQLARLDGAAIHLVHAVAFPMVITPYEASVPAAIFEGIRRAAREKLEEVRKRTEQLSGQTVTAEASDSHEAASAIANAVAKQRADLVVMGTHGYGGLKRAFLGSVAERTLRSIDTPVLAVKEDLEAAARPIERILVAVDFSPHSDRAVEIAASLAKRLTATVALLHVIDTPRDYNPYASTVGTEIQLESEALATQRLDDLRRRIQGDAVSVAVELKRGDPPTVIASTAKDSGCQLIVMGTRGLHGLEHVLLGSVAERTLRASHCAVLAVKATPPESPA